MHFALKWFSELLPAYQWGEQPCGNLGIALIQCLDLGGQPLIASAIFLMKTEKITLAEPTNQGPHTVWSAITKLFMLQ